MTVRFGFRVDENFFWPVRFYFNLGTGWALPAPCKTQRRIIAFRRVGEDSPLAYYDWLLASRPSQLLTSGNSER